mgnify:CR=1 FL=1
MNTEVRSERMVVISDLHIGNPFCSGSEDLWLFINQAREEGYDLCINGDGFDIIVHAEDGTDHHHPRLLAVQRFGHIARQRRTVIGNLNILSAHVVGS